MESAYPLFRIWEVHQEDFEGEIAVELDSGGEFCLIHRPQFRGTVARITPAEAQFLKSVQCGAMFGAALDSARGVDAGFNLALSLKEWVTSNIVVAIETTDTK